uniref:Uncharacterized protein n=1 Tax=Panagrolaimus davidi TaxID=227884 RepID=A0A914QMD0_9BILA
MANLKLKRACETYDGLMGKAFVDCKIGYTNERLDNLHNKAVEQIHDDILGRIKNEGIVAEVFENLTDQLKNIFIKYKEKNEMLVETEKKCIELIEAQRRHEEKLAEADEKLAKEKMEHELRQFELYEQQVKERRQHEREQIQAENERMLEARKHQEEMRRIENHRIAEVEGQIVIV